MDHMARLMFIIFGLGLSSCSHVVEYHYVNQAMTWTEAQRYCRENYTDLATFESMDDINKLTEETQDSTRSWIGLYDDPKSWKESLGNDVNSWRWSATQKTSVTGYHNWAPGQPTYYLAVQNCVLMKSSGIWEGAGCRNRFPFICYEESNPPGQTTYILVTTQLSWLDSQAHCRKFHTDLAMAESAEENTAILSVKVISSRVWIGLYREPWRWSDDSSRSFTNWLSGQPNNYGGNQHCVAELTDHFWDDQNCDLKCPFWCHRAVRMKKTVMSLKIQSDGDLSDEAVQDNILQQLTEILRKAGLTDVKLTWKTRPKKTGKT